MANTFTLISSVTVGSGGAANISFTSIPQTYTDLLLKVSARTTYTQVADNIVLQFNGDTGANYSFKRLESDGSAVATGGASSNANYFILGYCAGDTATSNTFGSTESYIPNYTGSNYKSAGNVGVSENNATLSYMAMTATIWNQTSAITSIRAYSFDSGDFKQYSTAYLYGISNA